MAPSVTTMQRPDPPHSLLLEDVKGLSVFWSGTEAVSKLVWRLTPSDIHKLEKMSISEMLEKFAAQDYIRNCVVSLVVSAGDKITRPCRMSDNFSTLWADSGRGQTVKLALDASRGEVPREISSKYLLILSEMNKKRVFWDGRRPVSNLIFRVSESQMLTTVDTTLRKFLALDYLRSRKLKLELVVTKKEEQKINEVHGDDILGSLFTETSASLRITMKSTVAKRNVAAVAEGETANPPEGETEVTPEGETAIPTVTSQNDIRNNDEGDKTDLPLEPIESSWTGGKWLEIREKVQYQLEALDSLRREREIPTEYDQALSEEKRLLVSSLRRRSRSVEQVWRHYEQLKVSVDTGVESFPYKLEVTSRARSSVSGQAATPTTIENPAPPSDSSETLLTVQQRIDLGQTTTSCISVVASTLQSLGINILDEDQRVSPVAGMAFTVILVVAICVLSHCVS